MKRQSGFTLIELVIVVVILGFLAVTAIPKFLDLTDQAKQANIEGMAGGFATGVSLARAQWEAEGRPNDSEGRNTVNYDGTDLYLTSPTSNSSTFRPGYPMGTSTTGLTSGNMTAAQCVQVWNGILSQPPKISSTETHLTNDSGIQYFAITISSEGNKGTNDNAVCAYFLVETLDKVTGGFGTPTTTDKGNNFTYDPASSRVAITINN
ncbi:MSHA biogenesis protein MshB [Thalassotalea insulae]|uniref:MSHA biogenesis protein MshB n=1 Tax=Thalassotalea insulae TaxID=2056778 RepID=A0ABQ6GT57_9GAMM|nr:type II secretion system protein [Thalassotalea insulae]GLX77866.1 MSHA biogenesis protein MshB [Thalassotalea insulae]